MSPKTVHVVCEVCGASNGYSAEYEARRDGWSGLSAEGVTGPWSAEYTAKCGDCSTASGK